MAVDGNPSPLPTLDPSNADINTDNNRGWLTNFRKAVNSGKPAADSYTPPTGIKYNPTKPS